MNKEAVRGGRLRDVSTSKQGEKSEEASIAGSRGLASVTLRRVFERCAELPLVTTLMISLAMVATIGFVDVATGNKLSVSIFYLGPVFFAVWFGCRNIGILVAAISTITLEAIGVATTSVSTAWHIIGWNTALCFGFFMVVLWLLDDVKHAHASMAELSRTDSLTGLCNHGAFYQHVEDEIRRKKRHGRPFTVAYVDMDGFKAVNDRLGHLAGDSLLRLVAQTLRAELRNVDVIGRLGGDEYAILMPETGATSALVALNRLKGKVAERLERERFIDAPALGFTIGAICFYSSPESADFAVGMADYVMYEGRQVRRGSVTLKTIGLTPAEVSPQNEALASLRFG